MEVALAWEDGMIHPSDDVDTKLMWLCDAITTWERATGPTSVLVFREVAGFTFRAVNGKPIPDDLDDVGDDQLMRTHLQ